MRRKYLGLAIAAITALGPASAFGGDREIAEEIMTQLKSNRDSGALKDFTLDMKVDQGVVLFRGSVSEADQKRMVLAAAEGVEGIQRVVDEVSVTTATPAANAAKPEKATALIAKSGQSLRKMLVGGLTEDSKPGLGKKPSLQTTFAQEIVPGEIQTTAAVELAAPAGLSDQQVVAGVVKALGAAQNDGRLKGFGVDVKCSGGVISLKGRAGSAEQRDQIVRITQAAPGVRGVDQMISVIGQPAPGLGEQYTSTSGDIPAQLASNRMSPVQVDQVPMMSSPRMMNGPVPVAQAATPMMGPQAGGAPVMGTPMQSAPVAMSYGGGVGAPRYDAPNLPNYAWPGYAAHPNYAALTYPQQYSPSAWPYIGPFYPYPQVPLGWRKVSLEWDDGWWFLDFTDR